MANWLKAKDSNQLKIFVPKFKAENYYAEFEVIVESAQNIKWKTYKRYSEFKKLYDDLIKTDSKFKTYFPPKKSFNSMSSSFLDNRRISLEKYLNEIILLCSDSIPRKLMNFLEMDKYEIHGITTTLAKTLFDHGNTLLKNNHIFEISVLYIYAINERIMSPMPTNLFNKPDEDFGNVLEIVNSLKKVLITPNSVVLGTTDTGCGTSTIKMSSLTFDISIFSSVTDLQINGVEIGNLRGLYKMNTTVERLRVRHCLKSVEDLLFVDFPYTESSIDHLQKFDGPLRCTTDVDFSHNSITVIDKSIVTLRQVQQLNLSFNHISDLNYMHKLIFLTDLDISYNNLYISQSHSLSTKLGSIKRLSLKGNKLSSLIIIDRMFSLEYLDVSDNILTTPQSLLSLCRLSCLESMIINDNPICRHRDFPLLVFDVFLDRYDQVKVNGYQYKDLVTTNEFGMKRYRATVRSSLLAGHGQNLSLSSSDYSSSLDHPHDNGHVTSVDIRFDQWVPSMVTGDWILTLVDVYNVLIYWFFVGHGICLNPKRLLWVTEIFSPNRNIRPTPVLLITSGTHQPNMLKCRLSKSNKVVTIHLLDFLVLHNDGQRIVVGSDKSFVRVDRTRNSRDVYLCNSGPQQLETFICQLYHIEDGSTWCGDSRIVYLNEEDRMEMMRRFVDVWRVDMDITMTKDCTKYQMHNNDSESEFIFISRAMLQMRNNFQMLLTVVVTRDILYLVDERIYDWPDLNRYPNLSDLSSGTCGSPYTLSGGQFPFLRTNAYFLCQIDVCDELPINVEEEDNFIDSLCPVFQYPVKITFNCEHQSTRDPLTLLFVSDQKSRQLCRVVRQQCTNAESIEEVVSPFKAEPIEIIEEATCVTEVLYGHLRHLSSSYSEIRLSLAGTRPQLSKIGQLSADEVLLFLPQMVPDLCGQTIVGVVWCKFIYDGDGDLGPEIRECPGLVSLYMTSVVVLYEQEEENEVDKECNSDPEDDRGTESERRATKLKTILIDRSQLLKVFVGLNYQWLSCCVRDDNDGSECGRLVLLVRNKTLCKHIIGWLETITGDNSEPINVEYSDRATDVMELLRLIEPVQETRETDFVHYCCLEDVRFGNSSHYRGLHSGCKDLFSLAAVITMDNLAIVQHNVCEFPIREYRSSAIQRLPSHPKYQVVIVVSLVNCMQLQLPGHDRSVVIIVIRSPRDTSSHYTTVCHKIQLSITCQKEQKRLIDKLQKQRSISMKTETLMPVNVC